MASLDALLMSLERFKGILSSESAQTNFETAVRSIQPDLKSVHVFIDSVYAKKDPKFTVTMTGRTLVVEIAQTSKDFYDCIHDQDIDEILSHITAVGSLPAAKPGTLRTRDYTSFPVKYVKGQFMKTSGAF
jgi:glycerate kinase